MGIVLLVIELLGVPSTALALEAVASRDGQRYLVNKDIGGQRWAIARNLDDGTVTGNVFFADGSEPRFVWCDDLSTGSEEDRIYGCWGADRCESQPCDSGAWTFLTEVPLSASFFRPAASVDWGDDGIAVTLPRSFFAPPPDGASTSRDSGVQVSRDEERVLISKDIGGERWAITRNVGDGTVTGNVFFTDGRAPAFLWCDGELSGANDVSLLCFFAEERRLGPIEDVEGNYFVNQLSGDDGNDGSLSQPFATIEGAIESVPPTGGRIYVAAGVYRPRYIPNQDETAFEPRLHIYNRSRIQLFGSFNPRTWVRDRESFPSRIETGPAGITIHESAGIVIDGFTIRADPAEDSSYGSTGVVVVESRLVEIRNNTIRPGAGADGLSFPDQQPAAAGGPGGAGTGGAVCISPASRSGGSGGGGALGVSRGGSGGAGRRGSGGGGARGAETGQSEGGAGGASSGAGGRQGSNGTAGTHGIAAPHALDAHSINFSSLGVFASTGTGGAPGVTGSGGGGGAGGSGSTVLLTCGGGGGGGGAGGLGGLAGSPGGSGGSSIAVAVGEESDAEIFDNILVPGDGGHGAPGARGGVGGAGGAGGRGGGATAGNVGKRGGNGGSGGRGGDGGHGQSGAGGSSIGIFVAEGDEVGTTVVVYGGNTYEFGTPGLGARREMAPEQTHGPDGLREKVRDLTEAGDRP